MKIKLNRNMKGHKTGEIIDLDICSAQDGRYWRKAIRDSKIDDCVSIITEERKITKKKEVRNDAES